MMMIAMIIMMSYDVDNDAHYELFDLSYTVYRTYLLSYYQEQLLSRGDTYCALDQWSRIHYILI